MRCSQPAGSGSDCDAPDGAADGDPLGAAREPAAATEVAAPAVTQTHYTLYKLHRQLLQSLNI